LHDNARPLVAKIVNDVNNVIGISIESLTTSNVFTRLCSFRLSLISIDAA